MRFASDDRVAHSGRQCEHTVILMLAVVATELAESGAALRGSPDSREHRLARCRRQLFPVSVLAHQAT